MAWHGTSLGAGSRAAQRTVLDPTYQSGNLPHEAGQRACFQASL